MGAIWEKPPNPFQEDTMRTRESGSQTGARSVSLRPKSRGWAALCFVGREAKGRAGMLAMSPTNGLRHPGAGATPTASGPPRQPTEQ